MSLLVDTNILLYAVNAEAPQHARARAFVEQLRQGSGFCLTWSILYEWLRVVTHPRVMPRPLDAPTALAFVRRLSTDPRIDVLVETSRHAVVLEQVLARAPPLRGSLYHDAHIAAVMTEHGVGTIATADRHFRLFAGLEVLDPTAPS